MTRFVEWLLLLILSTVLVLKIMVPLYRDLRNTSRLMGEAFASAVEGPRR